MDQHEREVRQLRKKLRQVERLEAADWTLNPEEEAKLSKKTSWRARLATLLNAAEMKRRSTEAAEALPPLRRPNEAALSTRFNKGKPHRSRLIKAINIWPTS
jgi:hypothetical protein